MTSRYQVRQWSFVIGRLGKSVVRRTTMSEALGSRCSNTPTLRRNSHLCANPANPLLSPSPIVEGLSRSKRHVSSSLVTMSQDSPKGVG